jgi:four helix bundle protein
MAENKLITLSMDFAVDIVNLCKDMKGITPLKDQLLRSGTSIGANIREANYAHGKPDFIAKLQIALKECYETEYWLELFLKTDLVPDATVIDLKSNSGTIRRILIASIKTTKDNVAK